jgi:hypothetical protein
LKFYDEKKGGGADAASESLPDKTVPKPFDSIGAGILAISM